MMKMSEEQVSNTLNTQLVEITRLRQQLQAAEAEAARLAGDLETARGQYPPWIAVSERLPEHLQGVLVWASYDGREFDHAVVVFVNDRLGPRFMGVSKVTNWMPLPEPPDPQPRQPDADEAVAGTA